MKTSSSLVVAAAVALLAEGQAVAQTVDPAPGQVTVVVQGGSASAQQSVATTPPPCASPCSSEDRVEKSEKVTDRLGTLGFRTSATHGSGNTTVGIAFAGRSTEYADIALANSRETLFWALGGGGAGFEGAFGGSLAGGFRVPFDKVQGTVFRIGLEGYILGNKSFYASMFEIPQGQIGYQLLTGSTLFEIGGKAGAVLTGRFRDPTIDATRKFPLSPEWGGYASLHFTPFRVDASFTRIEARNDDLGTPIDLVEGAVCSLAGPFSLCFDGRYERGDIALATTGSTSFRSLYGGATIGFGWRPEKDHRRERATTTARAF